MTNRKIILCAFSSPNLIRSAKRLKKQAIDMKCYDEINIISINDLDSYGQEYIKNILKKGKKRGYGYWFWKPYIIKHYLDLMNDNDVLHYCDIGCHLRTTENKRFKEYINILESNSKGILAFQYKEILIGHGLYKRVPIEDCHECADREADEILTGQTLSRQMQDELEPILDDS